MSLIQVKVEHGRTFDEARDRLDLAVREVQAKFGVMVRRAEWSPGRDSVILEGPGVRLDLRVDHVAVHVTGDLPILGGLLGSSRLKQIVESTFKKS
jgi:Putative polyhydroxyalkanoic acid system protein (PHA_gran_rgn)